MESAPSVGVQTSTPGADAPHGFQQALPRQRQASDGGSSTTSWCSVVFRDRAHWTSGHRRQHRKDQRAQSGGCSQAMHSQCRCRPPCLRRIDSRQHHIARSGWPGSTTGLRRGNRHAATSLSSVAPSTLDCSANAGTRSSTLCANAPPSRRQTHRLLLHVALRLNEAKCLRSPNAPQVQARKRAMAAQKHPEPDAIARKRPQPGRCCAAARTSVSKPMLVSC
ncbi:hypothetical protein KOJCDNHJ_01785 [Xanthomonas citri pv. punicae]|nr:hypothetical protein FICKIIDM_02957 [Xanthomonas citri pv. punicae]UIS28390.1 hypothetical protein KOJCDNHJ_01785 [Xanthomonas citri pv. punicae]